jgi:hypothetical protein
VVSAQWALPTPPDRSKTAQRIGQLRKCDLDQRRPGRRALHHHKSCVSGHSSIPLCRRIGRLSAAVSDVVAVHTGSVGDGILTNDPCSSGRWAWAPRSASRAVHPCAPCGVSSSRPAGRSKPAPQVSDRARTAAPVAPAAVVARARWSTPRRGPTCRGDRPEGTQHPERGVPHQPRSRQAANSCTDRRQPQQGHRPRQDHL